MGIRRRRPVQPEMSSAGRSLADVVENLSAEFESTLGIQTVVLVVRRCHRELEISGSSPELLEPHARRRLQALDTIRRPRQPGH